MRDIKETKNKMSIAQKTLFDILEMNLDRAIDTAIAKGLSSCQVELANGITHLDTFLDEKYPGFLGKIIYFETRESGPSKRMLQLSW